MLLPIIKIRQTVYIIEKNEDKISDYRIHFNNDLGLHIYIKLISNEYRKKIDYKITEDENIIIEEFTEEEKDSYDYIFSNSQKIDFGYKQRFNSFDNNYLSNLTKKNKAPIYTFYSYKGGMGRTTTLASFAMHCAYHQGLKVLIIDSDLEAPGFTNFFDITDDKISQRHGGLVEYIQNKKFNKNIRVENYLIQADNKYSNTENKGGTIYIMPAGNLATNDEYFIDNMKLKEKSLSSYNTHLSHYLEALSKLEFSNPKNIINNFNNLFDDLQKHDDFNFDIILIDARTGFNDILGTLGIFLADTLVGFFREESQSEPSIHFLFQKLVENKLNQNLVIVNSISSDYERAEYLKNQLDAIAEYYDTGEGPVPYTFAGIEENSILKKLGSNFDKSTDKNFIKLIREKKFNSYEELFEKLIESYHSTCSKEKIIEQKEVIWETKINILKELHPYCKELFSEDIDFDYKNRFYYRNVMLNIFNIDKFLILASKGTGKTLFYKSLQNDIALTTLKKLANRKGDYKFVNVIRRNRKKENFFKIDKFTIERDNVKFFFHRFWIIYLWKSILLANKDDEFGFKTNKELEKYVRYANPNDNSIADDFKFLINDNTKYNLIEEDLKIWDNELAKTNSYIFACYDYLDEIVAPEYWETGYAIAQLFNYWKFNPFSRILPKLFARTDLYNKIVGITNFGNLSQTHSINLEWKKDELFALLFKQILAKSKKDFLSIIEYYKGIYNINSKYIKEIKDIIEKHDSHLPLNYEILRPLVNVFFGKFVSFSKYGTNTYDWFFSNLRNADDTISIRPFLSMLNLAIERVYENQRDLKKYSPVLSYTYFANAKVREKCVEEYFNDLASNTEGNKPLKIIFNFIKKLRPATGLKKHSLTSSELYNLLQMILEDNKDNKYLLNYTIEKLENLLISNGIIKKTYKRGGSAKYNFAYLYKFHLGLKSRS